jgi:hypothetical protein
MRCGADALLARVVQIFGSAQAHHGYLFANSRASCVKLIVHDGFGVWCAARRLNCGQRQRHGGERPLWRCGGQQGEARRSWRPAPDFGFTGSARITVNNASYSDAAGNAGAWGVREGDGAAALPARARCD